MILSFQQWWADLSQAHQVFYGIAAISSGLFLFQLLISLIGFDSDTDFDDVDLDAHDIDGGFSIFSIRGIIAFFMFFGWGGVAALYQGFNPAQASMVGFLIGFLAMVAVAFVIAQVLKLQESGTVPVDSAISHEGDVYLTIPGRKEGKGRIQIEMEGKTMEFEAITADEAIETGRKIRVVDVLKNNVMVVQPIS